MARHVESFTAMLQVWEKQPFSSQLSLQDGQVSQMLDTLGLPVPEDTKISGTGEYNLFAMNTVAGHSYPFLVDLHIDSVPISMELDTGASLSIMSAAIFGLVQPTTRKLRTYTGEM